MPSTPTQLYRGNAPATSTVVFTNTNGNRTVVSSIIVANDGATETYVTIALAGVRLLAGVTVAAYSTVVVDNVRQVLTGTETIAADGGSVNIKIHISGTVIN